MYAFRVIEPKHYKDAGELREKLINAHIYSGEPCSCGCGKLLTEPCSMHHGILPKSIWRGKKPKDRKENHPYNCFMVNDECHEGDPEWYYQVACKRYGRGNVEIWYHKVQGMFKSILPVF